MASQWSRIVLIGLSGSGKTTTGRILADRLVVPFVDTDADIERERGRTIPEIFQRDGEDAFREIERRVLAAALAQPRVVVATGGGAVIADDSWSPQLLGGPGLLTIALETSPDLAIARLREQAQHEGAAVERPLLAGNDPLERLIMMKAKRQAIYDRAKLTLVTDGITPAQMAAEIAQIVGHGDEGAADIIELAAPSGRSTIVLGDGQLGRLGFHVQRTFPNTRRVWVISDTAVSAWHGPAAIKALRDAGLDARLRAVPVGEVSKSWAGANDLFTWLLGEGIERGDGIVALGGGVIGDLAGFVAATVLRGVGFVQVPTSLLATVDSSVGGKTGINHPAGKNLIGAFYQPPLVVIDPALLATLPPRELSQGWAEIIKHAVIQLSVPGEDQADLWSFLERNVDQLLARAAPALPYLIGRNVRLKAAVVEADERESGLRQILNFGHTIGHAVEAAGYQYLHGEAIAIGLRAAARLGAMVGTCDEELVNRLDGLLDQFGLPARAKVDHNEVWTRMRSDKKRTAGRQQWILPLTQGGVVIRSDVPEDLVREVIAAVTD